MGSCASAQKRQSGGASPKLNSFRKSDDTYSRSSTEPRNSALAAKLKQNDGEEQFDRDQEEQTPVEEFVHVDEVDEPTSERNDPYGDIPQETPVEDEAENNNEEEEEKENEELDEEEAEEEEEEKEEEQNEEENDEEEDTHQNEEKEEEEDDDEDEYWGVGKKKVVDDGDIVQMIVDGHVDIEVPSQAKLVRIFTSSTFTDTFVERNNLMERVYPKLKKFCQSVGYDFQVVDMRWGVRDEATDDHMTSELCMRELRACQKLSTGPNFITFLGQKYGYRPFPPKILRSEFEAMLHVVEKDDDKDLLKKWFIKDDNLVPAMYILQPVRSLLPNYNNRSVSAEERSAASGQWWGAFEAMQMILREASVKAKLPKNEADKYRISVTEDEIRRGIINAKDQDKHCFWFKRNIVDLKENLDKSKARMFIDKTSTGLDDDAVTLLETFKKDQMLKVLSKDSVKDYDVHWSGEAGIDPVESEEHRKYIDELCDDFYEILVNMVNKGIEEKKKKELEDSLVKEVSLHTTTCQEKCNVFYGREEILEAIMKHVDSESSNRVLVVNGESGCGKTSIMAVAAKKVKESHPDVPLILRFLGTTSESSTINKLLYSICVQLCRITNKKATDIPESFKKMVEYFAEQLRDMESKVIIFLDSLDQLSPDDGGLNMKWLPKEISTNVTIVVSTLPGKKYKVLPAIKTRVTDDDAYIEVPVLPQDTAYRILDAWLKHAKHTLTKPQKDVVMNAFDECPLPLFLKLSFDEAIRWKSYTQSDETLLQKTVKDAINGLFARIERLHGHMLVSHALGYITASVNGLTDAEIDDVLSIDDEVLNDVYQYWTPPFRRIPPLLWIRIKTDLGSYIVSRGADGVLVNTWYHRQFIETARERYLQGDVAVKLHETLSEYFLGKWSGGVHKPFTNKQGENDEKDRLVPSQPNTFPKQQEGQENDVYNYRKLSELPRHLIKAGKIETLKSEVLFNFDFLSAELCALGLRNVLQDFSEALEVYQGETEIELIRDCLKMSGKALYVDPNQLASQLNGRLSHVTGFEHITNLLEQSRSTKSLCLYPSTTCFEKPGGPLVYSLAGHTGMVNYACLTKDGKRMISSSQDTTLRLWDMTNGEDIRTYDPGMDVSVIKFYNDDKCVIMCGFTGFVAMDLESEEIIYKDEYIVGQYGTCLDLIANGTKAVHAGNEKISTFDVKGRDVKPAKTYTDTAVENRDGFYDIIRGGGNYYAYSRGKNTELTIRKADDPDYVKKLKVPYGLMYFIFNHNGSELLALGTNSKMTDQYKEVHLVIWETSSWNISKDSKSKFDAMIIQMYDMSIAKLKTGYELICPFLFQINLWNLNTDVERVTLKSGYQGNQYKLAVTADGRFLVTVSMDYNQRAIQVYNLDLLDYTVGGDQHLSDIEKTKAYVGKGEREAYMCPGNPELVLSIPPAEAVITVWNARYNDRERQVRFEGMFPSALQAIDEKHLVIWDHNTRKIFLIDYMEGKIDGAIEGKISETPPSVYCNTWFYMGDFNFLAVSEQGKDINLWNMKSGKLLNTIKTGSSMEVYSMLVSKDKSTMIVSLKDNTHSKTTLPAVSIDLITSKKLAEIEIEGQRLDLRPEVTGLSNDGKILYVTFMSDHIVLLDTKTGKELSKITYATGRVREEYEPEDNIVMYCMATSDSYIAACLSCLIKVGSSYENQYRLVCFDLKTRDAVAWNTCPYYQKMSFSEDGSRLMGLSQPVNEDAKSMELWDFTAVKDKKLRRLGKFFPETDLRFNYMTLDASCVVTAIAGTNELVFLRLCGEEQRKTREEKCVELKVVFNTDKK